MAPEIRHGGWSRRTFLRIAAGGALTGSAIALASACTSVAPAAPTSAPAKPAAGAAPTTAPASAGAAPTTAPATTSGAPAGAGKGAYPTFIASTSGPPPDFPAVGPGYQVGYKTFPKNPPKSWTRPAPGQGSNVVSYTNTGAPLPPTPKDQNPVWQEVNKQLNANVDFQIISQADYPTKLATMMAGNDLTDFILIGKTAQNVSAFMKARCADLTPYLGGDAARDYPNLAAIPTYSWTNSSCVRDGKLYMVPISRYQPGNMLLKNTEVYDAEIGQGYVPKDAADFKRILQALTKPQLNRYGMGPIFNRFDMIQFVAAMYGAPKNWRLGSDGKLTKDIETPEFKDSIAYFRDLVQSGVFYPDAAGIPNVTVARDSFIASKFILDTQSYGNAWQDDWIRGPKMNPAVTPGSILPFPARAGDKAIHFLGDGYYATTALKQASPDRIKELLGILDWVAAPFGSQEDLLLTTGLPDRDYTLGADGNPITTQLSNVDANSVPWKYLTQHPQVAFWPGIPDYAQAAIDFEKAVIPVGVQDPVIGMTTPTIDKQGAPLQQQLQDGLFDLVTGRRPLTDYDAFVKEWQSGGGEQIRTELQQALAANG